jgi:putative flippase GtrA
MLSTLHPDRRRLLGQLARFVVSGAFVTAIGVGVYAIVALLLRWHPQIGNFMAYVVAVALGYFMHSRWSFRDHGSERNHVTKLRYTIVSIISYVLNTFWVWLIFTRLELGPEVPIIPMLFVTPAVTFILNRQWVFR